MGVARGRLTLVPPATLRGELWRRGLRFALCQLDGMLVVDAGARRCYVEERVVGGRATWIVHDDGGLGRAAVERVCATPGAVVDLVVGEVA
jgi:hypothetical protein